MNPPAHDNRRAIQVSSVWRRSLVLLGGICLLAGCFDADAMIASRQDIAQPSRLEEVDLGAFLVTLPYRPNSTSSIVVDFHAFGRVAHGNDKRITQILEQQGPELRHHMLIAVRELKLQELQEPALDTLRANIKQVVNETLADYPMQAIGFYRFSLLTQ
jgi:uncharacterized lipoprotein YajG